MQTIDSRFIEEVNDNLKKAESIIRCLTIALETDHGDNDFYAATAASDFIRAETQKLDAILKEMSTAKKGGAA
ncbi:MAG: hypothetical protein FWE80_06755 [Oscillospiraceae bacterium]|nr:hypothetical protein [Oscillospiraceae bacterium]